MLIFDGKKVVNQPTTSKYGKTPYEKCNVCGIVYYGIRPEKRCVCKKRKADENFIKSI